MGSSGRRHRSKRRIWGPTITLLSVMVLMIRAVESSPAGKDRPKYFFDSDGAFNISTDTGVLAPKCSRLCYPFLPDFFESKKVSCSEHEGNPDKWVPCLCTDRPFIRMLTDCVFRKCGPAIASAFHFGYHICAEYNISFPSPPDAIRMLNITVINDAIVIPLQIDPPLPQPFSDKLPDPLYGASTSDDNPGLKYEQSLISGATSIRMWRIGQPGGRRLAVALVLLAISTSVLLL